VPRASGILLHPTSLPGPYGIGDLGPSAYRFVDFLAAAGQRYWQMLPLGPTGYGDSPYQAYSAFAGNPLLISPERLIEEGLLPASGRQEVPAFPEKEVDFDGVSTYKWKLLEQAFRLHVQNASAAACQAVEQFAEANRSWLDNYALFMALKDAHGGAPWTDWPADIAGRQPEAVARWAKQLAGNVQAHRYAQFLFFQQWSALKQFATERGVDIIGDVPIYVAHNSADCWAHRDLFTLGHDGQPTLFAGVPPDYFSATGQLWGNPLYRWGVLARTGYAWWVDRLRAALVLADVVRLDHFRGFAGYWAIPAGAPTAETGRWLRGPGATFFRAMEKALGTLPMIAEDLGLITPDVEALRDRFDLPGMRVLQFAFGGGADNPHLPHNYTRHCVVYTGTHDNDTSAGWLAGVPATERQRALEYMGSDGTDPVWDLIRLAHASVADTAIIPLQDILGLGGAARMNRPGEPQGNWRWRCTAGDLDERITDRLAILTARYGRSRDAQK